MDRRGAFREFAVAMATVVLAGCASSVADPAPSTAIPSRTTLPSETSAPSVGSAPATSSSVLGQGGRIVVAVTERGADNLYVLDAATGAKTALLADGFHGDDAVWSPDGAHVMFDSDHAATTPPEGDGFHIDLYVVPATGGTPTALTTTGVNLKGTWSADGRQIAYERADRDGAPDHIAVMSADGTGSHDVTTNPFGFTDEDPSFSPDGSQIAFQRHDTGSTSGLFVVTLATGAIRQLTPFDSQAGQIDWSPDGSTILFNTNSDTDGLRELETIHPDGTGLRRLGNGWEPSWSPDGTSIVFVLAGQLWSMRADGTGSHLLVPIKDVHDPDWGS